MKTDVETLSPTRVRLTVEVPFDEIESSIKAAYTKVAQQVQVPGFRPGKVPPKIIDQRFGRGVVLNEAVNEAVPRLYGQALEEKSVYVLGQPDLEITKLEDGEELAFTAEVDVRPDVDVPDYDGIPVTVDDAEVSPDEVEEELTNLRERFASLKSADRPAQDGDHVSIDLSATVDGEELEDAQASGMSYEVGQDSLVDGLDEALRGMSAGGSTTFHTELVGEREGQEAEVTVTLHSVKEKDLPELDDEFAQLASEFDTIGELRADIRGRLEGEKRSRQESQARDRALQALLERVEIPVPDVSLQNELERRYGSIDSQLESAGLTRENYLQMQGRSEEDFKAEIEDGAEDTVRSGFLLDALALKEELNVEESELSEQLVRTASQMGVEPQQLAQHLTQNGQVGMLVSDVLRNKALALLVEHAKITDESGRPVDGQALLQKGGGDEEGSVADTEGDESGAETVSAETAEPVPGSGDTSASAAADAPAGESAGASAGKATGEATGEATGPEGGATDQEADTESGRGADPDSR